MKKIYLLLTALVLSVGVFAQGRQPGSERYVTNGFWDNWYIQLGVGGQAYVGESDSQAALGDRITPAFELSVGKNITPTVGLRVQAFGLNAKGFSYVNSGAKFLQGKPNAKGLDEQNFDFLGFHGDVTFNVSNFFGGYRTDRFYEPVVYAGAGLITETNDNSLAATGVLGLINKFRLSDKFDLNLEVKLPLVQQDFDGQRGGSQLEGIPSVTLGFTYKFKERTFKNVNDLTAAPAVAGNDDELNRLKNQLASEQDRARRLQRELEEARNKKAEVVVEKTSVMAPLATFFEIGKAKLTAKEKINLEYVASVIKQNPGTKYTIVGYADKNTGTADFNKKLSERRIDAVVDVLTKAGVDKAQLILNPVGGVDTKTLFPEAYLNRVVIVQN